MTIQIFPDEFLTAAKNGVKIGGFSRGLVFRFPVPSFGQKFAFT
jgi:hypothetical protein